MAWRKIEVGQHRAMPWKNGGGSTAEVAIAPAGASVAGGFDWRLSIATIEQDGPFSAFAGYDRWITLLAGKGMILTVEGRAPHMLDRSFVPFPFSGDAATDCRLIDGRCEDLNLMVARDRLTAETTMWASGAPWRGGGPMLVFLCQGAMTLAVADDAISLSPRDALVLDGGASCVVRQNSQDATALVASFAPKL